MKIIIVGGHGNAPKHPFFGTQEVPTEDGANQWCRFHDTLFEPVEIQRMALRRARSLMDAHLKAPGAPVTVLSGPSHAEEVGRGLPACLVVAGEDGAVCKAVQACFSYLHEHYTIE